MPDMNIKMLATSDLHLGRRSSGLSNSTPDASAIQTWNRLVDLCIEQGVSLLLVAGDVIDRENLFFESIRPLVNGLTRLADKDITSCLVAGNHDFDTLSDAIQSVDSNKVHLLGAKGEWERKQIEVQNTSLQIVGKSFTSSSMKTDPLADLNQLDLDPTMPSVGIVHGEVDAGRSKYGPIDRNLLTHSPIDAWFIGHIHKPQILREETPLICYPGSPHAFSASEPGLHGPWSLKVLKDGDLEINQIPLSPIRYETVDIDVSEIEDKHDFRQQVLTRLTDSMDRFGTEMDHVKELIADVRMTGVSNDPEKIEIWAAEIEDYEDPVPERDLLLSVRKVKSEVSPAIGNLEEWAGQNNPAGVLADILLKLRSGNAREDELISGLMDDWKMKVDQVNRSEVYQPLRTNNRIMPTDSEQARDLLQRECERLLMQLIQQQNKENSA